MMQSDIAAASRPPAWQPQGMRAFLLVWVGQLVSLFGTALTRFALTIWAWQITGEATALALVGFFSFGPMILLTPFAGAIVDRANRKLVMMLSDMGAGVSTIIILVLYTTDSLQIWHLYLAGAFSGVFQAFQFPAYSAATTMMLTKKDYARSSAMLAMAEAASGIFAPAAAAALLAVIGISGVMLIDVVTFLFALGTLLIVYIPQPPAKPQEEKVEKNLLKETAFGFRYILDRPSLLGLQMMFFTINLMGTLGFVVEIPMILIFSNNNELALGTVQSFAAVGGLLGGLMISIWGGPKNRVLGVAGGMFAASLCSMVILGLGRSVPVWAVAGFVGSIFIAILNASNQAIWQAKIPPELQGRVFAVRMWIAQITIPVAMLVGGPLADRVLEPGMSGGILADLFGPLLGTGPGTGMSLMLVTAGLISATAAVIGYSLPFIRNADTIIPDHELAHSGDMPVEGDAIRAGESAVSGVEDAAPVPASPL